jgi:hypothetical protein
MADTCPHCGSEDADIMLTMVFCPNDKCEWYDQVQYERMLDKALDNFLKDMEELEFTSSDPDITPASHPEFDGTD